MGQVAAVRQVHGQDGVARVQAGQKDAHVGLGAGMRLHVGLVGLEQRQGPVDGQLFDDVDELAAAVIAPAGITLRVFVRQLRTLGREDGRTGVVFGGDHLQSVLLTAALALQGLPHFRICFFQNVHSRGHLEKRRLAVNGAGRHGRPLFL